MKRIIAIALVSIMLLLTASCGEPKPIPSPQPNIDYKHFSDENEFLDFVKTYSEINESGRATAAEQDAITRNKIDTLKFYYKFPFLPENATLRKVGLSDMHVAFIYEVGLPAYPGEIRDYYWLTFKWNRYENGRKLLERSVENVPASKPFGEYEDVYHYGTYGSGGVKFGTVYQFLYDGYYFYMYIPQPVFDEIMEKGDNNIFVAEKYEIK